MTSKKTTSTTSKGGIAGVVHVKRADYNVYIGRPSKWGNPFKIGPDGNRYEVLNKYEDYIRAKPELMNALHELDGKILGCWCHPRPCHGDVLRALREEQLQKEREGAADD